MRMGMLPRIRNSGVRSVYRGLQEVLGMQSIHSSWGHEGAGPEMQLEMAEIERHC